MDVARVRQLLAIHDFVPVPFAELALDQLRPTPDQDDGLDPPEAVEHPITDVVGNPPRIAFPALVY